MSKLLKDEIGFSGHGVTIAGSAGAVALGAVIVEKHVTLNKKMLGSDHAASLEFKEFKYLIDICKKIKIILEVQKKVFKNLSKYYKIFFFVNLLCQKILIKMKNYQKIILKL